VNGITEFLNRLRGYGDREAIVEPSRSWSYTELLSACEEVRRAIDASDLQSGDALEVRAEHGCLGIAGLLGSWASGIVGVPVNPSVSVTTVDRLRDIAHVRGGLDLDPIGVRIESGLDPDPPLPYRRLIAADVPGLVLFTSGSSGEPKGVVHDVDRLLTRFEDRRPAAKVAAFLLFDHIGGVNTVLHTLAHGGCVVTMPDRSPRVVAERIQTEGVQVLPTTPTYLNMLAIAQELPRLTSLELITYGTEVMPASTLAAVREALPHVRLLQTYGMSELGIVRSRSVDESTWVSIGGPELEWRVIDGTLRIRTTTAMAGYLNAPDPFDGDGWFDTGDEVEVDGDRIRFLGRRDDTINVGGQKVHPATVESVIAEVPGVLDVAVAAEPTPLTGHLVAATVYTGQSDPGLRSQIRARIRAACLASLEPWQVPARIRFTDSPMATDRFKRDRQNRPFGVTQIT
jgi:long-chain acyl-CoA synthetase